MRTKSMFDLKKKDYIWSSVILLPSEAAGFARPCDLENPSCQALSHGTVVELMSIQDLDTALETWGHEAKKAWFSRYEKNPRPPCSLVQEPCLLSQFKKMFWAAVQCAEPGSSPVLCCAPLPLTVYVKPSIKVGYLHYIFFSDGNVVKCSNADFINLV